MVQSTSVTQPAARSLPPTDRPEIRLSATTLARRLGPEPAGLTGPAYRVLAHRIRGAVLDGRLAVAAGLPSERELAHRMAVSRTTVAAAYSLLREEGWIDSRRGSGSRLTLPESAAGGAGATLGAAGIFGYHGPGEADFIDLSTASLPAPEHALAAAVDAAVADLPGYLGGDGYSPFGLPVLREAIAARYTQTGAPTRAEQILVTNGAQHALSLCLHELSAPGDRVMIECPTYPVALDAIRAARRIPGPMGLVDDQDPEIGGAWDVELIRSNLRHTATRLAYLIPDFQNPTGALMDTSTRQQLVAAARSAGTTLLIDESFREVPFGDPGAMPAGMATLGDPDRVICLGSVSKAFWGGLRIGWVRAAPAVINRLAARRALGDMSGPVLDQLIVAHLLEEPAAALAGQRDRLATGAAALLAALDSIVPDWRPSRPQGGACLWVRLPGPFATELARLAPTVGVRFAPGPRFGPDGTMESYLRMPFTAPVDRLETGVRRLAGIADAAAAARPTGLPGWIA